MDSDLSAWQCALQALLLLTLGLLSAAEAAFHALGAARARRRGEGESAPEGQLARLSQRLVRSPSGLRIAMVFTAVLSPALGAGYLVPALLARFESAQEAPRFSPGALAAGVLVLAAFALTLLMQAFCVAVPRRLAAKSPEKTARLLYPLAWFADRVFGPAAALVDRAAGLMRLDAAGTAGQEEQITEDEIRMLVDEGEEKGAIAETERDMIENVFEFNNMVAADCMTHRTDMHAVWIHDTQEDILSLIGETGLSRFPVYDEDLDDIVGTLTARDFLLNSLGARKPLEDILRGARFVPESVRTDVLFRDMQQNKFHMAIVVDEYGGTSGLVTMEDLLEEIVGKIYDEYDPQDQQDLQELGPGRWKAAGTMDLEAFSEATGLQLPQDEEYDTLGGLILSRMNSIPEDGSTPQVECFGFRFKVLQVAERRIEWVEAERIDA